MRKNYCFIWEERGGGGGGGRDRRGGAIIGLQVDEPIAQVDEPIRVHTTLLTLMCCAKPFSACILKKYFLGVDIVVKKKQIEMWFSIVCTLIDNEYMWQEVLLLLHVERVYKSYWKEHLVRTSRSLAPHEPTPFWPLRWRVLVVDRSADHIWFVK